jgi:enamine deaminase RidA (YjgF/YER057c/UK114 family)
MGQTLGMQTSLKPGWLVCVVCLLASAQAKSSTEETRWIQPDKSVGRTAAVVVPEAPLIFTGQIWPEQTHGPARDSITEAAEKTLAHLEKELRHTSLHLTDVVKLNVHLQHSMSRGAVEAVLAKTFRAKKYPAVTFICGEMDAESSEISLDAVAARPLSRGQFAQVMAAPIPSTGERLLAELPPGPKLFISGMADTNELPLAAVRTMEKLEAALKHLEASREDIVQLRIFLDPITQSAAVRQQIIQFFHSNAPPMIFIEWISPKPNPPIEIELVAKGKAAPGAGTNESVQFISPPGTTSTKTFSRVARVNHGPLIFISELMGAANQDGSVQVREIYSRLRDITKLAGSDFEHLVKAVYFVSDDDASNKLNDLRLEYYNPQKPPAASKAKVKRLSAPGRTVMVDMIAVGRD